MLTDFNVLIMGGDARNLVVMDLLAAQGATIYLVGYDTLTFENNRIHNRTMDDMDFSKVDAIFLPVGGTNLEGKMEAAYTKTDIVITKKMISNTPPHCVIYTGTSNSYLEKLANAHNRKLVVLFERNDLAIYNSIPTAEGALTLALEQTDHTIHGSQTMVLGFGRIGMTVAQTFAALGATVSVAARKSEDLARIFQMGYRPVKLENMTEDIPHMDLVINSIPHLILDKKVISVMNPETLIIDVASAPGGTDFKFAAKKGIKALHALGLPGKTAPKSAGKIIGKVFMDLLIEQKNHSE